MILLQPLVCRKLKLKTVVEFKDDGWLRLLPSGVLFSSNKPYLGFCQTSMNEPFCETIQHFSTAFTTNASS